MKGAKDPRVPQSKGLTKVTLNKQQGWEYYKYHAVYYGHKYSDYSYLVGKLLKYLKTISN